MTRQDFLACLGAIATGFALAVGGLAPLPALAAGDGGPYGTAPAWVPPAPTGERGVPDYDEWPEAQSYVRRIDSSLSDFEQDCVPWAGGRTALLLFRSGDDYTTVVKLLEPVRDDSGTFSGVYAWYWYDSKPIARVWGDRMRKFNMFGIPLDENGEAGDPARGYRNNAHLRTLMTSFPAAGTDPSSIFRDGPWQDICDKLAAHRYSP